MKSWWGVNPNLYHVFRHMTNEGKRVLFFLKKNNNHILYLEINKLVVFIMVLDYSFMQLQFTVILTSLFCFQILLQLL